MCFYHQDPTWPRILVSVLQKQKHLITCLCTPTSHDQPQAVKPLVKILDALWQGCPGGGREPKATPNLGCLGAGRGDIVC